jgi:soluble lytic murein transglycosylase-like protein
MKDRDILKHRGINQRGLMLAGLLLLAAAPSFLQADVYKWVDENGVVTFTNIAPPSNQKYQVLKFPCYASDPKCRSLNWKKVPLNTSSYRSEIHGAAQFNAVDESLIRAIIHAESAYQPDAQSPRGAQGLMQLMPATQRKLNISDPFDPAANIDGGTRYLADLLLEFNGDITLAAAAYNAGPAAVHKYGGIPPYDETREYVKRVKILYQRYQNL